MRLAGQDSRRGTFSQRHAVQVDFETGEEHLPLANLADDQGKWFIYDSLLSEYAALGFEYGYSVEEPGHAGRVGGAVRRLHQRRPDRHRPVHRRRRGQVGRDLRPGPAAAPRLRGAGSRAQLGPHRALPDPVRRGQHPGRQRDHVGAVLPRAASPDAPRHPQAPDHRHAEVAAAVAATRSPTSPSSPPGRSARRSTTRRGMRPPRSTRPTPRVAPGRPRTTATVTRSGPSRCARARSPTT